MAKAELKPAIRWAVVWKRDGSSGLGSARIFETHQEAVDFAEGWMDAKDGTCGRVVKVQISEVQRIPDPAALALLDRKAAALDRAVQELRRLQSVIGEEDFAIVESLLDEIEAAQQSEAERGRDA